MSGTEPDPRVNVSMLKAAGGQLTSLSLSLLSALGPQWGSAEQVVSTLAGNSQKPGPGRRGGGGSTLTRAVSAPSGGQSGQ